MYRYVQGRIQVDALIIHFPVKISHAMLKMVHAAELVDSSLTGKSELNGADNIAVICGGIGVCRCLQAHTAETKNEALWKILNTS